MRRREFVTLVCGGAVAAWPFTARGQQPALPIVGILNDTNSDWVNVFRQGLKEGGLIEGRDVLPISWCSVESR